MAVVGGTVEWRAWALRSVALMALALCPFLAWSHTSTTLWHNPFKPRVARVYFLQIRY